MKESIANQMSPSQVSGKLATWHRVMEEGGLTYDDLQKPIDDPVMRQRLIRYWRAGAPDCAREIMGANYFGIEEARAYFGIKPLDRELLALAEIPFAEETLEECKDTHILAAIFPLCIRDIPYRADSRLLYDLQSYYDEPFTRYFSHASWQLIRKTPIQDSTEKSYTEQQSLLKGNEKIPSVKDMVYALIGHYLATHERLFGNIFVRCSDTFSDNRRVQIGRFDSGGIVICGGEDDSHSANIGLAAARRGQQIA